MLRSRTLADYLLTATATLACLPAFACQSANATCKEQAADAAASSALATATTAVRGVGAIAELVLRRSNLTDSLTLASAERLVRVTPAGEVVFEDPEGSVPVTLSADERTQLAGWLAHPSFAEFLEASVRPCSGASGARASLGIRFVDGSEQVIDGLLSCVSAPGEDLGQIDYAFRGLTEFLAQVGETYLECPIPANLTDGISDESPIALRPLCGDVWGRLVFKEYQACVFGLIAEGVLDCSG
jgi:hypothetical protein